MSLSRLSPIAIGLLMASAACGKSEPEAPAEGPDKVAAPVAEEADAKSPEPEDAAAKAEDVDPKGRRNALRDRATRRPPPRAKLHEDAEQAAEGDAASSAKTDAEATDAGPNDAGAGAAGEPGNPRIAHEGQPNEPTPVHKGSPNVPGHDAGKGLDPKPVAALDAATLLPLMTVIELTGAKGLTEGGTLPGIAIGTGYVSVFYRTAAAGKFGVALQAWQDPARRESDDRFRRMRLQYPNPEDVQVLSPVKAFFARFNGIQMLTFVDSVKRVVATVSCGEDVCSHEVLTKLAKSVRERL